MAKDCDRKSDEGQKCSPDNGTKVVLKRLKKTLVSLLAPITDGENGKDEHSLSSTPSFYLQVSGAIYSIHVLISILCIDTVFLGSPGPQSVAI